MPEGDSIFHLAGRLRSVLLHEVIVSAQSEVVSVPVELVRGATVLDIDARGKNLLVALSTGATLHVHLRMHGRVRVRERSSSEPSRVPTRMPGVRLAIATRHADVFFVDTPVTRLVATENVDEDRAIARLGPDPLGSEPFDDAAVAEALGRHADEELGVALLDQTIMAGVGNVLKSEAMFCSGADPFAPVRLYSTLLLQRIVRVAAAQLRNTTDPRVARFVARHGRMTRFNEGSMRGRGSPLWVYERSGKECFVCGDTIRMQRQGSPSPRSTYFCRSCQRPRTSPEDDLVPPAGVMPRWGDAPPRA